MCTTLFDLKVDLALLDIDIIGMWFITHTGTDLYSTWQIKNIQYNLLLQKYRYIILH